MCGIAGILSTAPVDPLTLTAVRDSLIHRGPDHGANWLSSDGHVGLAHRRLAIIDLTPEANQPFVSWDARFTIVFNGEIYNFRKLRSELMTNGCRFQTSSDTEVIVEAYRFWGKACLVKLFGMFAFAIWDNETRELFCARDRTGEKPFHFVPAGNTFLFASELKAFTVWPEFQKRLNVPALIDYLTFGFVPDPKTIWLGCYKLPPGHSLSVVMQTGHAPEVGKPVCYWDMVFDPDHSVRDWEERIRSTMETVCAEMSFADVPVGVFLSGGVDSSAVTAGLSRAGCEVRTFTIGFDEPALDERVWARKVASQYKTAHVEKTVVPEDVTSVMKALLWHYDEPFNDYAYLPTFYLCREARKSITVALSGDGADELFGGYVKYRRLALRQKLNGFIPQKAVRAIAAAATRSLGVSHSVTRRMTPYGSTDSQLLGSTLNTAFTLDELRTAARGRMAQELKHYSPADIVTDLLRSAPPREVGLINSMRYLDLKLTLAGDMLVKVDRASMAVALEVRPVYLHPRILELAAKIPPGLLADRNETKKPLKQAMEPWLPMDVLYRKKMGFAMPLPQWLNGELKPMMDLAPRSAMNELIAPKTLGDLRQAHAAGASGLTLRMHSLFFLSNWLEAWA